MAQGKKKRKINDTKTNGKKEELKKKIQSKEEPTTNSAKKEEKEIVKEKTQVAKKRTSTTQKSSKEEIKITSTKEKKEPVKKEEKTNNQKETKTTTSPKKQVEKKSSEKIKKTETTNQTKEKKVEEKKKTSTTTAKKKPEAQKEKASTKKTTETEKKEKVETKSNNTPKKKTSTTKKKNEKTSSKTTIEKKKNSTTKETAKAKSSKEKKKPIPLKKQTAKKEKKLDKQQIKKIGKQIIILLQTFFKKVKQQSIKFFAFSKVQAKKGKQILIKITIFLKKVLTKLGKLCNKFYKFLKEKYKIHKEKRKKKKEEKHSKKIALKEQKENDKKILTYQKEQTLVSNAKNTKEEKEIEAPKKKKRIPKSPIVLGILIILYFGATTLPYGTKEYISGASGKKLIVPKLTKLKEECCNYKATFTSIRSIKSLEKEMEQLINSYQKLNCDNKSYVYNEKEDYTITEYSLKKGTIFNEITITYGKGNSCELDTTFKKLEFLPDSFSIEDAKKDGNYVITNEKVYNTEAYTKFMEEVEKKSTSTLRIVKTNEEGDLLITDVEYLKDGKFKVTYDKTRDRNNNDNYIMAYKYDHIGKYKNKLYAYNGANLNNEVIKSKNAYYLMDIPE